jgi:DNA-binding response OmpR family regulator/HAMP domain-containing protein
MNISAPNLIPWKSWRDFTSWAQDFSLRKKVLGGFLGVVVLVGLGTSFVGTRLAREAIMDRSRTALFSDLGTAEFVLKSALDTLDLKIRLTAGSEKLVELVQKGDMAGIRNRFAMFGVEQDIDFLSIADPKGRVLERAFAPDSKGDDVSSDAVIMGAAKEEGAAGLRLVSAERLRKENPRLAERIGTESDKSGMVLEAARPILIDNRVAAILYGGVLLNNNGLLLDRICRLVFKGAMHRDRDIGYVALYQGTEVVATTLKREDGLPLTGLKASRDIQAGVLKAGLAETSTESLQGWRYISAAEPVRDSGGKIIGAIQLAALEQPITSVIDRLVITFLTVALLGVLLMAAISYFLVQWINRPLELMLNAARRAAEGDLSHEVPVIARDEVGELAATFNLMIRNLAASREKLEEWGRELTSKIAEQTGELNKAREQVARVKKLASLEKMADGMGRIMAHISDPLVSTFQGPDEESGATSRILVLDDEENVLDTCQRILEREGFEVQVARTVADGLKELEEEFFDVVIADIDMPEMRGKELLKEIKYRQPELLVILTAPFKATEQAVEAVELGAFDYIPKPFGPHQILLMVYTALQTRQALDKTRREHAAQRAEKIFQRLPVAIALADKAHRVVYNNNAFVELASQDGQGEVRGKTFSELFGVDPIEIAKTQQQASGSLWVQLEKVGRTAKLYIFRLPEEDLRVLMLLDITDTVKKDHEADRFRTETLARAQQVIHQQMRVAQEIAGLLGETTAETKAALFELVQLATKEGETR